MASSFPATEGSEEPVILSASSQDARLELLSLDGKILEQFTSLQLAGVEYHYLSFVGLVPRPDGSVVAAGYFYPATNILGPGEPMVFELHPDGSVPSHTIYRLPTSPSFHQISRLGAGINDEIFVATYNDSSPTPRWIRLGRDYRPVNDMHIHRLVPTADGRVHFSFRGQALGGYALEGSEDLRDWRMVYLTPDAVTDQIFADIPFGQTKPTRFYRVRTSQ